MQEIHFAEINLNLFLSLRNSSTSNISDITFRKFNSLYIFNFISTIYFMLKVYFTFKCQLETKKISTNFKSDILIYT